MSNAVVTDWPSGSANTGWPREPSGMLMPGRVQGWPAGTQRAANAAERLLSQATAWWDVGQYRNGDRFLRNRGTGGELLDLRLGSALAPNSNDPLFLPAEDQGYTYLPGAASNFLSVPDEAALDITGDLDLRVLVSLDDWTPSATQALVSKYAQAGLRSYLLQVLAAGTLQLVWSVDGTATLSATSTVATGLSDASVKWVRAILDVDNGASGRTVTFYLSDDGVTWTQLGDAVTTAGTTSVFSGSAALNVGSHTAGASNPAAGRIYRAQVLNGIGGTTVLDIDCNEITSGSATSFTALTGQTVTVNRSTSGRKSVAVPSRHKGGQPVMLFGTDDYLEVQDNWQHGLLNFDQGQSFTLLVIGRQWATPPAFARFLDKEGSTLARYMLRQNSTSLQATTQVNDAGGTSVTRNSATFSAGQLVVLGALVDRVAKEIRSSVDTSLSDATSIASVASLVNDGVLRIGSRATSVSLVNDMEFYGAAVFRRALSPAEITTLSNYFTGRIA